MSARRWATRGMSLAEKIAFYTAAPNERGCKLWTGSTREGYGAIRWEGKMQSVHRLTWEEANGPIPAGMLVCHECDTPACRTLEHLFLGTQLDNVADRVAKGRSAVQRGEASGRAKITAALAMEIFTAHGTERSIGARFGVTPALVGYIKRRQRWRHIHDLTAAQASP